MNRCFIGAVALGLLAARSACGAAALPLAQNGQSTYVIYHAPGAPPSVGDAAAELRDYIRRATGADLPVVTAPREPMICLGDNAAARAAGFTAAGIPLEGFRIATNGRNLYILGPDTGEGERTPGGGTSAGTRNGAYAFLERFLGVRWLMPGDHGDDVLKAATLSIPDTDVSEAPFFLNRRLPYTQQGRPEVKRWQQRQRLGFSLYLNHAHNWTAIRAAEFEQHPDWFAERGGVRVPPAGRYKLCATSDGMARAFAASAIAFFDRNPEATCFSLSPADSGGWCECANCRARYETDPKGDRSISPAIIGFYNKVAKLVAAKHPHKMLAGYVYSCYVFAPREAIPLEPNVFLPVGNGPVQVSFTSLTVRGALPRYAVYAADGAEVAQGVMSDEAPITLEADRAKLPRRGAEPAPYYHLVINAGSSSYQMAVAGAAWALEGGVDDKGLHLLGKTTPLYFEVPAGVTSFHIWLAAEPPTMPALATLYAPDGRAVADFDCTQMPIDRKRIETKPGDAGFWKVVIRRAPTGVMNNVYVRLGPELRGYLSLSAEQALSVAPAE